MTKQQALICHYAEQFVLSNKTEDMRGYAARSVSAAIRSALRKRDQQEMRDLASRLGIDTHPDFIV